MEDLEIILKDGILKIPVESIPKEWIFIKTNRRKNKPKQPPLSIIPPLNGIVTFNKINI
tara:strand:+ start:2518 stop:2694 length:177 start_codon:yes stop_codon:yes gene_type:complete